MAERARAPCGSLYAGPAGVWSTNPAMALFFSSCSLSPSEVLSCYAKSLSLHSSLLAQDNHGFRQEEGRILRCAAGSPGCGALSLRKPSRLTARTPSLATVPLWLTLTLSENLCVLCAQLAPSPGQRRRLFRRPRRRRLCRRRPRVPVRSFCSVITLSRLFWHAAAA